MDFVDVVDLEPGPAGAEAGVLAELADLLDAVVAGPVDLDDVDVLADGDRLADVAGAVGLDGRPVHAVQALGEDPGDRGLADPPGPAEEVGVRDPVEADRVPERLDDVILADDVLEPLGPVPPGDDGVAGRVGIGRRSGCRLGVGTRGTLRRAFGAEIAGEGAGESRGGAPGHMEAMLMAAAFPP